MTRQLLFLALILPITIISCTKRIDIKTDNNKPQLVITGFITTDTTVHKIYVSRTVQYFGNQQTKYYLDGIVKINDITLKADSTSCAYETNNNFYGEPGKTYNLSVCVDFNGDGKLEQYTSSATMPEFIKLDSIYLGSMSNTHAYGPPWMLFIAFQDVKGDNYYGAGISINKYYFRGTLTNYFIKDFNISSSKDGEYINFPSFYLEKEMHYKNSDDKFTLKPGDTIKMDFNCLSKEYYDFIYAAKQEIDGGGNPLFAGPPANVPSNISNGALGVFGAYTIDRKTIYLPETPNFTKE